MKSVWYLLYETLSVGTVRVFRGTNSSKDQLDITHSGGSDYGPGLYFATSVEDAKIYGYRIEQYDVTVNNPIHVGENENLELIEKLMKVLKIDEEMMIEGKTWTQLMSLVGVLVEIGQLSWKNFMNYLKKLGYDGIYVHKPKKATGDYVAVFDKSQVSPVV